MSKGDGIEFLAEELVKRDAEIARLRELKTPATRQLLNITKAALENSERECAMMRAALELVQKGFRKNKLKDQTIIEGEKLTPLSEIVNKALAKEGE